MKVFAHTLENFAHPKDVLFASFTPFSLYPLRGGILDHRVVFEAFKAKHEKYNFNISRSEILQAKEWGAFIVPSPWFYQIMVRIKRSDEKSIVLVTAKRKKLLSVLNTKSP